MPTQLTTRESTHPDWFFVERGRIRYWVHRDTNEVRFDPPPRPRPVAPRPADLHLPAPETESHAADLGHSLRVVHTTDDITQAKAFIIRNSLFAAVVGTAVVIALVTYGELRLWSLAAVTVWLLLFAAIYVVQTYMHHRNSPYGIARSNAEAANKRAWADLKKRHQIVDRYLEHYE